MALINEKITQKIKNSEQYYESWEISDTDFFDVKNNFVINDQTVDFYFDDCVMCPSYKGSYSIELPLVELLSVLKKSNTNPFGFVKNLNIHLRLFI
ncbi:DUF3298 domain-containing protein [Gelidibacter sp.]|uniref:DUF3298 domain-containing protein n=1 Tax=Gelidibacter sp. TaxID=2018083 RepID=UPI00326482AC